MKKMFVVLFVAIIAMGSAFAAYDYGFSTVGVGYTYGQSFYDLGPAGTLTQDKHVVGVSNVNVGYFEGFPVGYLATINVGYNLGDQGQLSGLTNTGFYGSGLVGFSFRANAGSLSFDLGAGVILEMEMFETALERSLFSTYFGAGAFIAGSYNFGGGMMLMVSAQGGYNFLQMSGEDDTITINNYKGSFFVTPAVTFGFTY